MRQMGDRDLYAEDNAAVSQRYALVMERISRLAEEDCVAEPFRRYFVHIAAFITSMGQLYEKMDSYPAYLRGLSLEELQEHNRRLYADILPENYEESFANPAFAVKLLGQEYGQLLSFVYTQIRGMIIYVYEGKKQMMTAAAELFMELYSCFEAELLPSYTTLRQAVYWYLSDYCDVTVENFIADQFDDSHSFIKDMIMQADLSDESYLYLTGEYVSANERQISRFLAGLTQEKIDACAATFVDGFVRGYDVMRMDLSVKNNVCIRAAMGFERITRAAISRFEAMGLTVHIFRSPIECAVRRSVRFGYIGTDPNPQYTYDHAQDAAVYMDKAFNERRLAVLRSSYEKRRRILSAYAGPAVQEVFGEEPFSPVIKSETLKLSKKQRELQTAYASRCAQLSEEYIDEKNTSFTIITYPIPAIGKDFADIFDETIRLNTLDNDSYRAVQQTMIDVLDQADAVRVLGAPGRNRTDIRVQLMRTQDPRRESKFENCVADVNIPLGEVFTSPVLKGTQGLLHVSSVYLNGYHFRDLQIRIADGMTTTYTCGNFSDEEQNCAYIRENILKNYDALPIGEFAIGTNTTAYVMAHKYGIEDRLPILIMEKTGPHFALGDTCYSRSEDHKVYNPDGKEIVARENEVSALRASNPQAAYFNCHTDITIPYHEIGEIAAVLPDGREILLLKNGRFVLPGTQQLNEPLEAAAQARADL